MARLNDWSDKLEALTIAGKYGEGGANTPVNKNTMPWLYEDNNQPQKPAGKDSKDIQLPIPGLDLDKARKYITNPMMINPQIAGGPYRMQGDGITEFWDTHPADRFGPRGASKYDKKIKEMNKIIAPLLNKQASIPESYKREGIGNQFDQYMQKNYNKDLSPQEKLKILRKGVELHQA